VGEGGGKGSSGMRDRSRRGGKKNRHVAPWTEVRWSIQRSEVVSVQIANTWEGEAGILSFKRVSLCGGGSKAYGGTAAFKMGGRKAESAQNRRIGKKEKSGEHRIPRGRQDPYVRRVTCLREEKKKARSTTRDSL